MRHYSSSTEEAYVGWARRFVRFHGLKHPSTLQAEAVGAFLTHLATRRGVSASTQNQALAALLFLYTHVLGARPEEFTKFVRASRTERLPIVLSVTEVARLFHHMHGTPRLGLGYV
jgi:site-specific recombinase XerD